MAEKALKKCFFQQKRLYQMPQNRLRGGYCYLCLSWEIDEKLNEVKRLYVEI